MSYADDMVLLAPTAPALQTLLEVCRHKLNTTKRVCALVRQKQSQGRYPTKVSHGNEELRFLNEFRYLRLVMTADCRDDKHIEKLFRRQNAVGNFLVRKFSFAPRETKIKLFKSYCYIISGCAPWRHLSH